MKRCIIPNELRTLELAQNDMLNKRVEVFYTFVMNNKKIESMYLKMTIFLPIGEYEKLTIDNKINFKYLYFHQRNSSYLNYQFSLPF
jgi:hypothetical protein